MSKLKTISRHEKRTSLRCPLSITESSLLYDKGEGRYNLKITLFNDGNGTLDNDTVESALIVIRCTDESGTEISFGESEYLAKTVKFGESGLSRSDSVSITVLLELEEEIKPADYEIYISRIRFADMSVLDYLRADFFNMPGKPVPIIRSGSEEDAAKAIEQFGPTAAYVPEKLTDVVWRCTCGEICDAAECPMCGAERDRLFELFPPAEAVKKPAAPAPAPSAEKQSDGSGKRIAVVVALAAAAVILLAVLIGVILNNAGDDLPSDQTTTAAGEPSTTKEPETPPEIDDSARLALAYADRGDFENALAAAKAMGCTKEVTEQILSKAVDFYSTRQNFLTAYEYAKQIENYEGMQSVTAAAYNECLGKGDYDRAAELAVSIGDSSMKLAAVKAQTDMLAGAGDYAGAYEKAKSYGENELASQIISSGIDVCENSDDYEKALSLAKLAGDDRRVSELNRKATLYYVSAGDLEKASAFAAASGDEDTLRYLCTQLPDPAIMRNYPSYASYLEPERKRILLASRVSAGSFAAVIAPDGAVLYGAGEVYLPANGKVAVSVATSGRHTVVLHSDGTVAAFGDNTYGQCNVSAWNGRNIVMIAVGKYHTVALTDSGDVLAVGRGNSGQTIVSSMKNRVMICAGDYTTLSLGKDGRVSAVGRNTEGQCGVSSWKDIVSISSGAFHSVGVTSDGKVVSCGSVLLGMSAVSEWENIDRAYAGSSFTLALSKTGSYKLTGGALSGSVGSLQVISGALEVSAGDTCIVALMPDGRLISTGALAPDVSLINDYIAGITAEPLPGN